MKKIDWTVWKPRLLYGGFVLVAFVLSLRWTFPREAVKERLIVEAGARGWQIDMTEVGAGGVLGFSATDVHLEDANGFKISLDRLEVSLELLPLLTGRRVVALDARMFEGRITGTAALSGESRPVRLDIAGVNLAAAPPLKRATGLDLAGTLGGRVDLELPAAAGAKPTGQIDLSVTEAGINGGKLPIPGLPGMDGLPLQKVALGTITAAVKLDAQGKAVAEKLEAKGGDAELVGDGLAVTLQPKLEYSPLFGRASLRLQPAFWQKSGMGSMQGLVDQLAGPARRPDGSLGLQVVGSLGHPRVTLSAGPP